MSIPVNSPFGYYAPKTAETFFVQDFEAKDLSVTIAYDSSLEEDLMANLENLYDEAHDARLADTSTSKEALLKEYCESIQNVILLAVRNNLP